jgi:Flp pilus assembly protein TadB
VASSQQSPRSRPAEPVLITEAEPSLAAQHSARKKRYAITMGIRSICVLLAAVFYHILWLMLIFAILGTVLPWVAVIMANDRPPKSKLRPPGYAPRPDRVLENPQARVIEG